MIITPQDFEALLVDRSKKIAGDITWTKDQGNSPALVFQSPVESDAGHPLVAVGWMNPQTAKLSFSLIYRGTGRVYGLDLGADHRNPDGERVGEKHKHRWKDRYRDKWAYVPSDITEPWSKPVEVWRQFCGEAMIVHNGEMRQPQSQEELPI